MQKSAEHRDCLHFAPIDVVKGICHRTKAIVAADEAGCEMLTLMPKCKHCSCFTEDCQTHEMGLCTAGGQSFWAYADMVARQCEDYVQSDSRKSCRMSSDD